MKREELLAKGYTEEQVTDLLNTFHSINSENKLLKNEVESKQELVNQNLELQRQLDEINKANMTEQEKLESEKAEVEKNLANARKIYNKAKVKEILAGENIDEQLIDNLVSEDEATTIANANLFKTTLEGLKETVAKQTKESITNLDVKPQPTNIPQGDDTMTAEKFNSMTLTEQVMWKRENAQEYEQIFNN
jgi:hypothetical protein